MDSLTPLLRSRSWTRLSSAAPARSALRLEQLEDRTVPSSSIQLAGTGFKPIGPGVIEGISPANPTITTAGRISSIVSTPIPFDVSNPTYTGPTDPADPTFADWNTYYVGSPGGGVAKTTDGGQTWKFLTDNLPPSTWGGVDQNRTLNIGAINVSPFNKNIVLAGTGEAFGEQFFVAPLSYQQGNSFAGRGILRSADGGTTWLLIKGPGNDFDGGGFTKFVFHPTDPNIVFAVFNRGATSTYGTAPFSGVSRSLDAGVTGENVSTNITGTPLTVPVTDFMLDPTNPAVGYIAVGGAGQVSGVYRSSNFLNTTGGPQPNPNAINFSIALGGTSTQVPGNSLTSIRLAFGLGTPTQPSRIYVLSSTSGPANQLFRSDDSGINFRRLDPFPGAVGSTAQGVSNVLNAYNLILLADPTNPNRIFVGGRGAGSIQVLTNADYNPDNAATNPPVWVNLTIPSTFGEGYQVIRDMRFDNTGAKDVNQRPINPGRLLIATESGVYRLQTPSADPTSTTSANYLTNNLALVNLNGTTGPTALGVGQFFSSGLAPRDDNRVIGGTYLNGSATFQDNGPFSPTSTTPGEAQSYKDLYGWDPLAGAGARGSGGTVIFSPINPQRVYRVSNQSAYDVNAGGLFQRSVDGGATWTTSTNGLVNPIAVNVYPALAADPSPQLSPLDVNESRLFLGTNAVNTSTDGGQNWTQFGPDLPFVTFGVPPIFGGSVFGGTGVVASQNPTITAIANGRSPRLYPIYVAVRNRWQDPFLGAYGGPALYRWNGRVEDVPLPPWRDVSPGVINHLLPGSTGAQTVPDPNSLRGIITSITVDPTDARIVYITCDTSGDASGGGRVWRSINAGETWTDISGNLPETVAEAQGYRVYSLALDPRQLNVQPGNPNSPTFQTDDDLYIGTTVGVWKLTDPTSTTPTWTRLFGTSGGAAATGSDVTAGQLPDVMVRDVKLNTTTGVLSAATFGRGIWQVQIRPYIRGLVYEDQTGNGVNDTPGDTKLAGAVVLAFDIAPVNGPVQFANTTTTVTGEWVFRSLPDSTYTFQPADASTVLIDKTTKYYFTSAPITQVMNQSKTLNGLDMYVFRRISINGKSYEDANGNGAFDVGENPSVGFTVSLIAPAGTLNATDTLVSTTTTDVNGNYTFLGVGPLRPTLVGPNAPFPAGYRVQISKAGFQMTEAPVQTGPVFSGVNLTDAANQKNTRVGLFQLGQISGTVFGDTNGDGAFNNTEVGKANWVVQLFDSANNLFLTTTTGANGAYTFGDQVTTLKAGTYHVRLVDKAGFVQTSSILPDSGVFSGANNAGQNIGVFAGATVNGDVYEDTNGDGIRQASETTLVPNVTVSLLDPRNKAVVASVNSDAGGHFSFATVFPLERPGNTVPYLVRFTNPLNLYSQSSPDATALVTSGGTIGGKDIGLFTRTTVSGFAFEDINGNGLQDPGEVGLVGGSVSLLNSATLAPVYTTTTDASGNFQFTNVGPISGPIAFRLGADPIGFFQTTPNPADFFVTSGKPITGLTIGLFREAVFTGLVFEDINGNGTRETGENGLAGQVLQLVNTASNAVVNTSVSDVNGNYRLAGGPGTFRVNQAPLPGFTQTTPNLGPVTTTSGLLTPNQNFGDFQLINVSGRVFNDLNGNRLLDGEPGLAGWTIQLVNVATGAVVRTTTTDANGFYVIAGVGPGNYRVQEVLMPNFVASTPTSRTFTTASGASVDFLFGNYLPSVVTGQVIEDLDRSLTVTTGDIPSQGWTVQLLLPGGVVIATQVTGATGGFSFGGLAPGSYQVQVVGRPGWSVLANGSQAVVTTSGSTIRPTQVFVLRLASLSGTVYLDVNRNNKKESFERGLAGGVVGLFDANGAQVATQATDASGAYTFFGVQSGTFTVRLITAPDGFQSTSISSAYTRTVAVGSTSANNLIVGLDFGLLGRKRYALAADGGGGPRVQVFDAQSNAQISDSFVYEVTFTGGVRVASADVNGDGIDDLIVVPGVGGGPRVRVLDGKTGAELYNYFAYEPDFRNGLYVTAADVDGDGFADIITGTAPGGGPRVTVFSGKTGVIIGDYFAYDSSFRGGVRVGAGDVNGDGIAEIITAPGEGAASEVRTWGGAGFQKLSSFLAFDASYTGGVYLAGTTANVNGRSDIVVGTGIAYPSAPLVRVFDGVTLGQKLEVEAFPSGGSADQYTSEVRVASFDRNGDGVPDIAIASGSGSPSRLRFVDGVNRRQIGDEQHPFESAFLGGIFIG